MPSTGETSMSPQVQNITNRLDSLWLRWWTFTLLTGVALVFAVALGSLLLLGVVDAVFRLAQGGLAVLFALWAVLTLGALGFLLRILRRGQRSLAATARRLEMTYPELESHLINIVQYSEPEEEFAEKKDLYEAAAAQAALLVGAFPFEQAPRRLTRWRRLVLCMLTPRDLLEAILGVGSVLVLAVALNHFLPGWSSGIGRILRPWTFVPSVGRVQIGTVTPGDHEVLLGSDVPISATVDNPGEQPYSATLYCQRDQGEEQAITLQPDEAGQAYHATISRVLTPVRYRLVIGDSQTRRFTIGVREKPGIAEVKVTYHYPRYVNRPADTRTQQHADLEALQYSVAELAIRASTPIARGHLLVDGQTVPGWVEDNQTLRARLLLRASTTYTVHLFTEGGYTDAEPRINRIKVLPDVPPSVQILEPARDSPVASGAKLGVLLRATDDHGLGMVRLEMKHAQDNPDRAPVAVVATCTRFPTPTSIVLKHNLLLEKASFPPGHLILVRAVAQDRRDLTVEGLGPRIQIQPQETVTPWLTIRVVSPEAKATEALARLDSIHAELWKILQTQIKARLAASQAGREKTLPQSQQVLTAVRTMQIEVQKATTVLAAGIDASAGKDLLLIKRAAGKVALGDMVEAVRQVEALARLDNPAALGPSLGQLTATQERIIDVLRRLLNEVRRDTAETLAEMKTRPGGDLPPEVQAKLRELKDKLNEFQKQQKKVIEGSENLAKKPVEDFSDKDAQLLRELAAIEDDWSRFLEERHSDLSKLPEQDFSNPTLLKELVALETELQMAKDALTKKAVDIAVPLEQLGAEMAKEITSNIEKWLPDTPDRERWSQEESLTDAMKEAPMAELPQELEDMVGKLMEDEEDLFDELEDLSSSWADSLDKGAGWDAMDGPISNNSAKGVTGNRLPNTNEIAGRSGEGRQGKASGEFVGDTAEGKGGRKTPTRMTPDPFLKGEIKDKSKDPTGGATGGGKESGLGGQGLEGPQADRPQKQMQRLAAKQAELRNKAETIDLKFKVMKYQHTDMKKLIERMQAVEQDLKAGRYQNALRRREVMLEGMGQTRLYLQGEFALRKDQSPNLPTGVQKEILGSMQEPSPSGWDLLNQRYFDRLAGGNPAAPPRSGKE